MYIIIIHFRGHIIIDKEYHEIGKIYIYIRNRIVVLPRRILLENIILLGSTTIHMGRIAQVGFSAIFTLTTSSKIIYSYKLIVISLRVRAVFHKIVQVCHVYCNFNIGFKCRITVIFGTLKDGSLLINTLASTFVLATETCSKMASTLCQK